MRSSATAGGVRASGEFSVSIRVSLLYHRSCCHRVVITGWLLTEAILLAYPLYRSRFAGTHTCYTLSLPTFGPSFLHKPNGECFHSHHSSNLTLSFTFNPTRDRGVRPQIT